MVYFALFLNSREEFLRPYEAIVIVVHVTVQCLKDYFKFY